MTTEAGCAAVGGSRSDTIKLECTVQPCRRALHHGTERLLLECNSNPQQNKGELQVSNECHIFVMIQIWIGQKMID